MMLNMEDANKIDHRLKTNQGGGIKLEDNLR